MLQSSYFSLLVHLLTGGSPLGSAHICTLGPCHCLLLLSPCTAALRTSSAGALLQEKVLHNQLGCNLFSLCNLVSQFGLYHHCLRGCRCSELFGPEAYMIGVGYLCVGHQNRSPGTTFGIFLPPRIKGTKNRPSNQDSGSHSASQIGSSGSHAHILTQIVARSASVPPPEG